jgi:hypothetical protein
VVQPAWTTQQYSFGWQPNYTIEGKILGQCIEQHFSGMKVGILYQDDDSAMAAWPANGIPTS